MPTINIPIVFKYKQVANKIYRPIVPIEIGHTSSIRYEVLIDSGADGCMLNAEIAEAIGIKDIKGGEPFTFSGVTGKTEVAYNHTVTIKLKDCSYQTKVGFSDGFSNNGYGIVGQKGFFDRFSITFDYPSKSLTMVKKDWV